MHRPFSDCDKVSALLVSCDDVLEGMVSIGNAVSALSWNVWGAQIGQELDFGHYSRIRCAS
jgi:hypothetical protein